MAERSLEVRIPISPRADYFNRIRIIAQSIREFYPAARIRVTVGAEAEPCDLSSELPWSEGLGVRWHWVGEDDFRRWNGTQHPYIATMMERFQPPFSTDFVVMLDADIVAVRRFDELFDGAQSIKGMMAHVTPFLDAHAATWETLYAGYGLPKPEFNAEVSGWRAMEADPRRRYSPPYFNTGVLFAPTPLLEKLYEPYMDALQYVRSRMDTYFFEQIALTLAAAKAGIPLEPLPLRYNYPNQVEFDARHPGELVNIRLLHFLRTEVVHRDRDFETPDAIRGLIARRGLFGSNEVLRDRIAGIVEKIGV